jgi:outer membrane protein OmpA-like peptidoglycan-associated protein
MRYRFLPVAVLLAAAAAGHPTNLFAGTPTPAPAQVTVNPKALEPLGGAAPHSSESGTARHPARGRAPAHHHATPKPAPSEAVKTEQPNAAKPAATNHAPVPPPGPRSMVRQPPVVPPAPPPVVRLAPLEPPPPAHPAPPLQPAPVVAGAAGEALPIPDGLRLTFGSGSTDLNPETQAALQKLAHEAAAKPDVTVTVTAYAAGAPDDPSTPRRLSLSRALSARTVLVSQGISSTHIYLRALGPDAGGGPPDRVDVMVTGPAAAKPEQ